MSYYILPKYETNTIINITSNWADNLEAIISPSLIYYLNNILLQFNNTIFLSNFIKINSLISSYKYIYSKIPTYNISISKLNLHQSSYIYIEIIQLCNLLDNYNDSINCININNYMMVDAIHFLKETNENIYYNFNDLTTNLSTNNYADIINIDLSTTFTNFNLYINSIINSICYILKNQKQGGSSIIKIDHLLYKPVIDILFILNSLFEKIYIIKPNISCIIKNDIYIVCKNFNILPQINSYILNLQSISINLISSAHIISSLINEDIPYYFLNKIEEANIIIYHQKIQYIDQINNILINNQKIDNIKKNNIQKCIQWCEKYDIPHNKIIDKANIFLQPALELSDINDIIEPLDINWLINPSSLDISNFSKQYKLLQIFNLIE